MMIDDQLLDYSDYPRVRQDLRDKVLRSVQEAPAAENEQFSLKILDPKFKGADRVSLKDQKKAILAGHTISDKLVGRYELTDKETGKVVGKTNQKLLMNVPYLTDRGTYIRNGTEYAVSKQFRLVPGTYTRRTDDGNVETQFNARPRTGPSFRIYMEPSSGNFYMRYKQRKVPLYPVLRAMGFSHERLQKTWGKEIADQNKKMERSPYAVNFLRQFKERENLKEEIMQAMQVKQASWDVHPIWKEAGQQKTMPMPENLDHISESDTKDFEFHAGGNDWEAGWSSICAQKKKPNFQGIMERIWFTVKMPAGVKNDTDQSHDKNDEAYKWGQRALDTWVKKFKEIQNSPDKHDGHLGFDALGAALQTPEMKQFVEQIGFDRTDWVAKDYVPGHEKKASGVEYDSELRDTLIEEFSRTELDPRVTRRTLGRDFANATPDALMASTVKILNVNKGKSDTDSRDSLAYQNIYDTSDFLSEKIRNDQGGALRKILWKIVGKGNDMKRIPPSLLDKHVQHLFTASGVAQALEEINPSDMYDQTMRVSRLGEGALPSIDMAPKESRNVQPSYFGYVDPVVAPESLRIGLDMRLARDVRRGPDNELYTKLISAKTRKPVWVGVREATESNIGFPEGMASKDQYVPTMSQGRKMIHVDRKNIQYYMPSGDAMFSETANLVPLKSGVKGMRLLMGNKFGRQALPLVSRQAPLVQTSAEGGDSVEKKLGTYMGAVRSQQPGIVKSVYKDHIKVENADGTEQTYDLYDNHPYARKTFIRNTAQVKAGQKIKAGEVLAASNYTDDSGVSALGTNLRIGYLNYDGKVFEDAVVISESAAKKMTSEHMYTSKFEKDKELLMGKAKFRALFPSKFSKEQIATITEEGVVKPGTVVKYGDPMVLAVREREPTPQSMGRRTRSDDSMIWKHEFPAVVTDAEPSKKGFNINVRANLPMEEGDKLSGRFGNKGVISEVIPDSEMPRDAGGRPLEVLFSPLGVLSRTNPAQKVEAALGKVAEKTGKPYILPGFTDNVDEDSAEFARKELQKHNLKANEDLLDPRTGKTIPGIFTGTTYIYKLQHTAEGKGKGRSTAKYTAEDQPAKGGKDGAKHIGDMEIHSLLAHGADKVLKDMKIIKGQKNDSFWRQLKLGQTPTMPGTPLVYDKFKDLMLAAGINLHEDKAGDNIFAMSNKQAEKLTGDREIKHAATYGAKDLRPIPGGLFDPEATGSMGRGDKWGFIKLPEPLPNPIMAEPIRRILGMKQKEFDELVSGTTVVDGKSGVGAVQDMLARVNMGSLKARTLQEIKTGAKSRRDDAVRLFRYIDSMEKQNVEPKDFMMQRVPVLPPRFRPITRQGGMTMVSDPNYLYKNLLETIEDYKDTAELPQPMRQEAWGEVWKSYKSVVGITDPDQQQLEQKNVGGILKQIFGKGSPKYGFVQRRVIGTNIDVSGMGVVTPNPALTLNQIGIPEKLAWKMYEPFIVRNMVKSGYSAMEAAKAVEAHSKPAYASLKSVIKRRPVLVNRAPTLHKYSNMAFEPVLTKGKTIQVPPTIVGPFGMDFDGDTASFTVPVSKEAVDQAYEKMLPTKNLISSRFGKPTYTPSNEYLQGLYFATKEPRKKPVKIFKTMAEAMKSFRSGHINIDDPIRIVE